MRTYGTAVLEDDKWVIEAEPHVMLRLKRVFGSVSKKAHGKIRISDTVDNCRDLEWFCERYPLKFEQAEHLASRAAKHRERASLVDSLLRGYTHARDFELAIPPRNYQRVAADLALASRGLLIADDVGLGKTATAICVLSDSRARPALIVAPTHLQRQWQDEIKRFAPNLVTHIVQKTTPYDYTAPSKSKRFKGHQLSLVNRHPDVLVITYAKLSGWAETLASVIKSIVFDEVHELRTGITTAKGSAAEHLCSRVEFRVGLSATPIFNYGGEIWNVCNFLNPGALGEYGEFTQEWCDGNGYDKPSLKEPEAFGAYVREAGLLIRRTREEVGRELPDLIKVPHHVESDESALEAIRSSAAELARIILSQSERPLARGEQFRAGGELDMLVRQATGIAKAPYVAQFVRMLVESGEKVVLYGWHREVYRLWLDRLKEFNPVMFTGTESPAQKEASKQSFINGDSKVFIISLRSGAGLDGLQYSGCRTVVFGELDWSPAVHEQCAGRVHRDGQTESVLAYYLISDSGSDPIVADVLGVKKSQLEGLRDPTGPTGIERTDTGGAHVRKLAEEFLRRSAAA